MHLIPLVEKSKGAGLQQHLESREEEEQEEKKEWQLARGTEVEEEAEVILKGNRE